MEDSAAEKPLGQEEIDALFEVARARSAGGRNAAAQKAVPYSFAHAGQINSEQMRAISLLNDLFARNLSHNLSLWLRSTFEVNLVSAEQMQFNEFLLRVPELVYVSSVRLEPLNALSVMQMDLALATPVVDLLLGGEGRPGAVRELTDIEESIFSSVAEVVCRELSSAWQPVGLSFQMERRQLQTQIARVMPVTEKTLCLSFEIRMQGGTSGLLKFAFPAVVANTILRRLAGDWGRRRHHSAEVQQRAMSAARRIRFGGQLQIAPVKVPASELEGLKAGSLVHFSLAASTPCEFRVGGIPLFLARAVRQGETRAALLVEPNGSVAGA